jgi:hypothetical protein
MINLESTGSIYVHPVSSSRTAEQQYQVRWQSIAVNADGDSEWYQLSKGMDKESAILAFGMYKDAIKRAIVEGQVYIDLRGAELPNGQNI